MPVTEAVSSETRTLERLVDVLQRELDAARERETMLLQMLSQMQQQNQRLLEAPRSAPVPASPGPGAAEAAYVPRGDMRRRIVALLQEYPEGLSPVQTRQRLGIAKDLGSTMKAMARTLEQLAEALACSTDYLLDRTDEAHPRPRKSRPRAQVASVA